MHSVAHDAEPLQTYELVVSCFSHLSGERKERSVTASNCAHLEGNFAVQNCKCTEYNVAVCFRFFSSSLLVLRQSLQVLFEERMRVLADHGRQLQESKRELSSSVKSEKLVVPLISLSVFLPLFFHFCCLLIFFLTTGRSRRV